MLITVVRNTRDFLISNLFCAYNMYANLAAFAKDEFKDVMLELGRDDDLTTLGMLIFLLHYTVAHFMRMDEILW